MVAPGSLTYDHQGLDYFHFYTAARLGRCATTISHLQGVGISHLLICQLEPFETDIYAAQKGVAHWPFYVVKLNFID